MRNPTRHNRGYGYPKSSRATEGPLHRSDYPRKPRGGPALPAEQERRFSLCCAVCRRRTTPPSVRFLGPKVYYGAVVILAACLAEGVTECQRRRHVPADHRAGQHAQLATETADKVPDLPAFMRLGAVQPRRAVRAGLRAGFAIPVAPAEGPFGESAKARRRALNPAC